MKECRSCGKVLPLDQFNKRSQNKDGLDTRCKECTRAAAKAHYHKHPDRKKDIVARNKRHHDKKRLWLAEYLSTHPCVKCGETDIRCLEFNHLRDKEHNIAYMLRKGYSLENMLAEMDKCEVLCANCHRKYTCEQNNDYRQQYLTREEGLEPSTLY